MKKFIVLLAALICFASGQTNGARYLIITNDNFYNDVLPLAKWKHKKGMKTRIARLSEIDSSATAIRNYIVNAYNTWDIKPEFILLVGAPNYLPFPIVSGVHSDNYYTNMDADIYNEILSGRFTVHSTSEMRTVTNKILMYERTPYLADSMWFRKACLIANNANDDDSLLYRQDVEYIASYMVNHGYVQVDSLFSTHGDNYQTVINNTNNGRGFVLYRGTGTNTWSPPFDVVPDNLANGNKLTITISATCATLGTGPTPALEERWFLTGSPTVLRGAAGYFATSTSGGSIAHLRSAVARGFFDGVFLYHYGTFGEACERGRYRVYNQYGSSSEYYGFTTVGDPEMRLWTATPCSIVVTLPPFIPLGTSDVTVNVVRTSDHSPVNGALVCLMANLDTTFYAVDTTDVDGNAVITTSTLVVEDTVFVTVTGMNLLPYEGYVIVRPTNTPYVMYQKSMIDDSLAGNNNGAVNPGETINLPLWVENFGDSTGWNVAGILRTADTCISISDSLKAFGDIIGHDSAYTGALGYNFTVGYDCPDGHSVTFDLSCRDANDSVWTSHFNLSVRAAELVFKQAQISGGNGNISFEVGETVYVAVILKNEGSSPIDSIRAVLHSLTPEVGIIDSLGSYDHIGPDSTAINASDQFVAYADTTIPQGTIADFEMILTAPFYLDTIFFSIIVGKIDYFIWNPDPTPLPGQNMHSILSSLGYTGATSAILGTDLEYYKAIFVCTGVFPNNRVINANGAEATLLTAFASNGGRLYMEGGDVWFYDPLNNGGHNFETLFGLDGTADGGSNMGPVAGIAGTFTNGMLFSYGGENTWMDHISPLAPGAFLIFRDSDNNFDCGVAYDQGTYRTVGTSFELGLLNDDGGNSTRIALLDSIMHFFGIGHGIEEEKSQKPGPGTVKLDIYPNPFRRNLRIKFEIPICHESAAKPGGWRTKFQAIIKIYNSVGQAVRSFSLHTSNFSLPASVEWNGTDDTGHRLPAGIYFVKLTAGDADIIEKIILVR